MIVGFGALGAMVFRFVQGVAIDRFGPMAIWLASIGLVTLSLLWHLRIDTIAGWEVFFARTLLATGTAGVFGAWMSFISLRVPERRVAEAIGVVGSSGFAGMAIGPWIGDWIFSGGSLSWSQVHRMLWVAIILQVGALALAIWACRAHGGVRRPPEEANPPFWTLVRLRHPWLLFAVTICLGLNVSLPANFVRPFAHTLNVEEIKWYFLTYNIVAFSFRLVLRRTFHLFGLHNMIVLGLSTMIVSFFLYFPVADERGLMWPAAVAGLGHAILYPAVIASGTKLYPASLRGAATNLMLAAYDAGVLIGSPLVGWLLAQARQAEWPEYATMFSCVALLNAVVVACFWWVHGRGSPEDDQL
jgi:MFS family permease